MRFRWLALICVFLLLIYGASPYFSFWRFTAALRSGDSAALSSRMDFPAIRASLKKQLVARFAQRTATHKWWNNLGPTLIDTIIDAYVTPEGIATLISNPEVLKNLRHPQEFRFPTGKTEDWSKVKHHSSPVRALLWSLERESNFSSVSPLRGGNSTTSTLVWMRQSNSSSKNEIAR
jgi:hypothetical protein